MSTYTKAVPVYMKLLKDKVGTVIAAKAIGVSKGYYSQILRENGLCRLAYEEAARRAYENETGKKVELSNVFVSEEPKEQASFEFDDAPTVGPLNLSFPNTKQPLKTDLHYLLIGVSSNDCRFLTKIARCLNCTISDLTETITNAA